MSKTKAVEPKAPENKPMRVIKSLDELALRKIVAEVELADGEIVGVPLRLASYTELAAIDDEEKDPPAPIMGVDGNKRPIFDYNNEGWLADKVRVATRRSYRRLIAMLDIPVAGSTFEEKMQTVDAALGYDVTRQLFLFVNGLAQRKEDAIKARAATFHANGTGGAAHLPDAGLDGEALLAAS